MKLVSAIIITHNRLELLKRAIESVKNQTYSNIECIVIDDNSTDGTADYCKSIDNILYIHIDEQESKGANHARNIGIDVSHGDYIAFLDDDDYWLPKKIEKQVYFLTTYNDGVVSCCMKVEEVQPNRTSIIKDRELWEEKNIDMSRKTLYSFFSLSSLVLVKKNLLLRVGKFDEELSIWQDYELLIRLSQITTFGVVGSPLVVYRVNCTDTHKATNKFYEWQKAVHYIYAKHKFLYDRLSFREKLEVKHLYYGDGRGRAVRNGLKVKGIVYGQLCKFYRRASKLLEKLGVK